MTEEVVRITEGKQEAIILALCSKTYTSRVVVFCGTRKTARRLSIMFQLAGLNAAELHGDASQLQRLYALERFRSQEVDFLFATDVAVRGLDIIGVQTVINFTCPRDMASYDCRMKRAALGEGSVVTFVTENDDNDRSLLKSIGRRCGSNLRIRTVAEHSVTEWVQVIDEQLEEQVCTFIQEDVEEKALAKADSDGTMVGNSVASARPDPTWSLNGNKKKLMAVAIFCFGFFCSLTGVKLLFKKT